MRMNGPGICGSGERELLGGCMRAYSPGFLTLVLRFLMYRLVLGCSLLPEEDVEAVPAMAMLQTWGDRCSRDGGVMMIVVVDLARARPRFRSSLPCGGRWAPAICKITILLPQFDLHHVRTRSDRGEGP